MIVVALRLHDLIYGISPINLSKNLTPQRRKLCRQITDPLKLVSQLGRQVGQLPQPRNALRLHPIHSPAPFGSTGTNSIRVIVSSGPPFGPVWATSVFSPYFFGAIFAINQRRASTRSFER